MKYLPITYRLLDEKGACYDGLSLFKIHVGLERAIPLTKRTIEKFSSIFNVGWAARNLLDVDDFKEYVKVRTPAFAKYMNVRNTAWSEYLKVHDAAEEKYENAINSTWSEVEKVTKIALAKYRKYSSSALKEFEKVHAAEFVRLYKLGMK